MMVKKTELLAPAGNMEKLKMALYYGADAVYLAGKRFSLRAYGGNFTADDMKEAARFVHDRGKKLYVTVNIIPRNEDLADLADYLAFLQDIDADGAIISDLGVFQLARDVAPRLPLHVSTQASAANWRTVQAWKDLGAARVVLAREVSIAEMADIGRRTGVELEYFIHGAMCISWSGRCLLSNFFTDGRRQSNRGECIQACRFRYALVEETRPGQYWPIEEDTEGTYILNSKDLCLIGQIPALIEGGAASLKIEGRMKSLYYTAAVTAVYRQAIDAYYEEGPEWYLRPRWQEELEKISHRPYTEGFAAGSPAHTQTYDRAQPEQPWDFIGLVLEGDRQAGTLRVQQRSPFRTGETVECLLPSGETADLVIGPMTNEAGERVLSAPHPLEVLTMEAEKDLPPHSILRRRAHG